MIIKGYLFGGGKTIYLYNSYRGIEIMAYTIALQISERGLRSLSNIVRKKDVVRYDGIKKLLMKKITLKSSMKSSEGIKGTMTKRSYTFSNLKRGNF